MFWSHTQVTWNVSVPKVQFFSHFPRLRFHCIRRKTKTRFLPLPDLIIYVDFTGQIKVRGVEWYYTMDYFHLMKMTVAESTFWSFRCHSEDYLAFLLIYPICKDIDKKAMFCPNFLSIWNPINCKCVEVFF